jgi:hypothetical protein
MQVGRLTRLSRRLLSQLEDFYVHKPNTGAYFESLKRELRVVQAEKTRRKLEKWFQERKIPIRFIFDTSLMSAFVPIGKKGVITYCYSTVFDDPPTAWMIVHNLSHSIYEPRVFNEESPYELTELTEEERFDLNKESYPERWERTHNLMGRDPNRPAIYPTTKSHTNRKITIEGEGFHELFAQWVVKGQVTLNPRNPALEQKLESDFRSRVDYLANRGAVVYNSN